MSIHPLISLRSVLRLAVLQNECSAGDERGIETLASRASLSIDIEAEITNFLARLPIEEYRAISLGNGLKGNQLNRGRSLNCRGHSRGVVCRVGIAGGSANGGGVGSERR